MCHTGEVWTIVECSEMFWSVVEGGEKRRKEKKLCPYARS